jgi:AcrR family transcriptional regulator
MKHLDLLSSNQKEDRRVSRTKRNINTAFLALLKQKELSKITIKELCELADINRKTFYTYFDSIPAVLAEIENQIIDNFQDRIEREKMKKTNLTVTDVVLCIGDLLRSNAEFVHQLVQVDALEGLEKKVCYVIKDAMKDALEPMYPHQNDLVNLTLEYIISGAVSMNIQWFSTNNSLPLKTLTDMTVGLVKSNIDYLLLTSS